MRTGEERERREVNKLFVSLQQKYDKIRSSHYQGDTKDTHFPIQNPQVY